MLIGAASLWLLWIASLFPPGNVPRQIAVVLVWLLVGVLIGRILWES